MFDFVRNRRIFYLLSAVFPLLKTEFHLSDTRLGSLSAAFLLVATLDRLSRESTELHYLKRLLARFNVAVVSAAGETNDVRITLSGSHFNVQDAGATITVGGPTSGAYGYCKSVDAHHAYCTALGAMVNWVVHLGDKNDKFFLSQPTSTSTEDINEIWGDAGNDSITASGWIEFLHGGDGNDTLVTSDKYCDRFYGDAGDDTFKSSEKLSCYGANQAPQGGAGSDTFDFSNRSESVSATASSAQFAGIENFIGGSGSDTLTGDGGPNRLVGGAGNDVLSGLGGDDVFDPGTGRDSIGGGDGSDTVTYGTRTAPVSLSDDGAATSGQSGENDTIGTDVENMSGGRGSDTLRGNQGDNVLHGGYGVVSDTIIGGGGNDTVSYTARFEPLTVTLNDGIANDGAAGENDALSGIANVIGGYGNDTITGTDASIDKFSVASSGRNLLIGGPGDDTLNGLSGNDTLLGYGITSPLLAVDDDVLNGGAGDDLLRGDTYNALLFFRAADIFNGGSGRDTVDYSDRLKDVTAVIPNAGYSQGNGESGEHDQIGSDVENINGGAGNDTLRGNDQANSLVGGAGNDTIEGGAGDDTLSGGAGSDTLLSRDTVHDSDDCGAGSDRVQADPIDTVTGCEQTFSVSRRLLAHTWWTSVATARR